MVDGLIGKKVGMTQAFDAEGNVVPLTVIKAGPCTVIQKKTKAKDGYDALQIGLVEERPARKPAQGPAGPFPQVRLARPAGPAGVRLSRARPRKATRSSSTSSRPARRSTSPARARARASRASSSGTISPAATRPTARCSTGPRARSAPRPIPPGSSRACAWAAGWAATRVTVRNLKVFEADKENNLLMVEGAVPGPNGSYVLIIKAKRGRPWRKLKSWTTTATATAELELPDGVFDGPVNEHLIYEAALNYAGQPAPRHGLDQDPGRGQRLQPQALAAEGHGPGPGRRHPQPHLAEGRHDLRPPAEGLRLRPAQGGQVAAPCARPWPPSRPTAAILIVEDLSLAAAKTKEAAAAAQGLKVDSALVVDVRENAALFTAMRNIPKVKAVDWRTVNTHDVLTYNWLVLSRQAFESLVEKLK